ncbi:MAG TPA: threonylcarbamoyl-AMP synthase, partial [Actinoallomurus sp.]
SGEADPSSIVDLTGAVPRLLRAGAISEERLREVCGVLLSDEDEPVAEPAETDEAPQQGEPGEPLQEPDEAATADEPVKKPADADDPRAQ